MNVQDIFQNLIISTGIAQMTWGNFIMIVICLLLIWLAIKKNFEPLLLLPIGFGGLLANVPAANIAGAAFDPTLEVAKHAITLAKDTNLIQEWLRTPMLSEFLMSASQINIVDVIANTPKDEGFLHLIFSAGVETGLFPLFIFMGVGSMTDFGPLIAHPKTAFLGAAAQFGIFTTLLGALALGQYAGFEFGLKEAAAIGIIGGADGPTAIFLTSKLAPHLLGAIAVAAYSYMALVPIIQPPIMRFFTTKEERQIEMKQLRPVTKREKIVFPILVFLLCLLLLPDACPLVGSLMFGNLMKECGVVDRLAKTSQNEFINIVTILLGLAVGSKLSADKFLVLETLGILILGLTAFCIATASGVMIAKTINIFSKEKINPLIGAAGVSAVPMAARVVNKVGLETNPYNFLLMHAMGPNVAGVIGSAVAAGVLLAIAG